MTQLKPRRILATGALPYANGPIHIGHLVGYTQADIWTRFQKLRGHECLYICGDDTHGTAIMISAKNRGITPEAYIAEIYRDHLRDFNDFQIVFDNYGSTHCEENRVHATAIYKSLREQNHIEIKNISQLFCEHDNMFLPDRFVKGQCPKCGALDQYGDNCEVCGTTYGPSDLKAPYCSVCKNKPVVKDSSHVFVKLNHFKSFLTDWVPKHTAPDMAAKLNEWLSEDLRDWDVSRDAPYFGFEIPDLPGKYFYVWVDAPIGYIASTEQWCKKNGRDLNEFWKSDRSEIYHFIGKDILYFHTLFWPAMLHASGFKTPEQVFVNGMLMVNGEKMSKSRGTFISAREYLKHLDPMYLRYYYAAKSSSHAQDLDLNFEDFTGRVNSDLIGKITNLGSRGAQMLKKRLDGKLCPLTGEASELVKRIQGKSEMIAELYDTREFARAINEIRLLADDANKYFDEKAPWKLINDNPEATREVLTATLNAFRCITIYLKPVLPEYADKVAKLVNEKPYIWSDVNKTLTEGTIGDYEHLATRIDPELIKKMIEASRAMFAESEPKSTGVKVTSPQSVSTSNASTAAPTSSAPTQPTPASAAGVTEIDIEDFMKVDLRIAKIIAAEAIPEADKLLRLQVELEPGQTRQIIAGIKAAYDPATLVGRLTVIVANLKPRKMKFGMSEGMVLAAGQGGSDLFIMSPDSGAKPGQKVK